MGIPVSKFGFFNYKKIICFIAVITSCLVTANFDVKLFAQSVKQVNKAELIAFADSTREQTGEMLKKTTSPVRSTDGLEIDFVFDYEPLGRQYVSVYVVDDIVFLPIFTLFNIFQLNIRYEAEKQQVSGFFINEEKKYEVDFIHNSIQVGNKRGSFTKEGYRVGENGFYIKPELYAEYFDLIFDVQPNRLLFTLDTDLELPVLLNREREEARANMSGVESNRMFYKTMFPRERTLFGSGFLDYQLGTTSLNGLEQVSNSLLGRYGFELAGGDMSGRFGLSRLTDGSLKSDYNFSNWRYVFHQNRYLTTLRAGSVQAPGLNGSQMSGITIDNEPLLLPEFYDTFPVFGIAEPGTKVELILDSELIDFTEVGESGEYNLGVPLRYGNSLLEVVKYLPDGRIRREERDIRIPGSFIKPGDIRYRLTAGVAQDRRMDSAGSEIQMGLKSPAAGFSVRTGITRWLTTSQQIGYKQKGYRDGITYLSTFTGRIRDDYLINIDINPARQYSLRMSSLNRSKLSYSGSYSRFVSAENDESSALQNASLNLSYSIPWVKSPIFLGLSGTWADYLESPDELQYRASIGFSILALRFRTTYQERLTNIGGFSGSQGGRAVYTVSTNTGSLPVINDLIGRVSLRGTLEHDVDQQQLTELRVRAYKSLSGTANLNIGYEKDLRSGMASLQAGVQLRFNKARSATLTRISNGGKNIALNQNITGSVGYDENFHRFVLSDRNMIGSSAASIVKFMDANQNDSYDQGEEILHFEGLRNLAATQKKIGKDGVERIWQLPQYRRVNIEIDNVRNPNPTAITEYDRFSIRTDPNRFKLVEIPFDYAGVAIGGIYQMENGVKKGLGGANFIIRSLDSDFELTDRTFSDGGFYVIDVPPGRYELLLDPLLASFLGIEGEPPSTIFTVQAKDGGDFVEGIEIILQP